MKIGIMRKGDRIMSISSDYVAVEHENGEVDIVPLIKDETGLRVDTPSIVTIGYGNNTVEASDDNGTITTF